MTHEQIAILVLSCVVAFLSAWVLCLLRALRNSSEWERNWQIDCENAQDRLMRWEELAYQETVKCNEAARKEPASS